jgi:tetratricopeptide (TPR) repeat protein
MDAKKLFEESIADDPDFAEAYAGLTDAYRLLGEYAHISMEEAVRKSNDLLSKALSLNEDLSEIRTSLGGILHWEYKFQEAESEFRKAISINPNYATAHHWYSLVLADMGRFEDAFIESRLAEEADPLSLVISGNLPFQYSMHEMREEAIKTIEKIESLSQKKYLADAARASMYMAEGEFEKSLEYMSKAVAEEKMVEGGVEDLDLATLTLLYSRVGKLDEAKVTIEELQSFPRNRFGVSFALGIALLGIGALEDGFNHLERSYEEHSLKFRYLRGLPIEDEVKNHPRFVALFKRANLQPNWY